MNRGISHSVTCRNLSVKLVLSPFLFSAMIPVHRVSSFDWRTCVVVFNQSREEQTMTVIQERQIVAEPNIGILVVGYGRRFAQALPGSSSAQVNLHHYPDAIAVILSLPPYARQSDRCLYRQPGRHSTTCPMPKPSNKPPRSSPLTSTRQSMCSISITWAICFRVTLEPRWFLVARLSAR